MFDRPTPKVGREMPTKAPGEQVATIARTITTQDGTRITTQVPVPADTTLQKPSARS